MPSPFSAILFDLDDTLADTLGARESALRRAFAHAGIVTPTAEEFIKELRGGQLRHTLEALGISSGLDHSLFDQYVSAYWLQAPGSLILFPGGLATLQSLHRQGVRLGVVTQKERALDNGSRTAGAAQELADLGIAELFSVVVGYEDVANHKPHPEPVLLALRQLGADPRETLMVGDSFADIESAKAASCWSCLATWGHERGSPLPRLQADYTAHEPAAILGLRPR
jgi:pyrophosphatase PpaX